MSDDGNDNVNDSVTDSVTDSDGISRRDALKILGAVPLTGALHWTGLDVDRAHRQMQQHPQQHSADPVAPTLKFFTPHEYATIHVLVDMILPRDERSGSATDARVPEFMDFMMAEASERGRTEMHGGLAWLDAECNKRYGANFLRSAVAQRTAVLDDIAWPKRARPEHSHGVAFFNSFRDLTASGFFSSEMGYKDLQYKGDVFNPNWDGCPPAALAKLGVSYDIMRSHRNSGDQHSS